MPLEKTRQFVTFLKPIIREAIFTNVNDVAQDEPSTETDQFLASTDASTNNFTARNIQSQRALVEEPIAQTDKIEWDETQLKLFTKLKEKVEEKKKEFEELTNSPNAKEEKMDLERALRRMDRLLEIPQSKLLRDHPEIFNEYTDNINKLLECDARKLNLILACTTIPAADKLESAVVYGEPEPKNETELKEKLKESLPKLETDIDAFYLPGLPIAVHTKASNSTGANEIKDELTFKETGLSENDLEKLKKAVSYITESGWLKNNPESLKDTESILILQDAKFNGKSLDPGHPAIKINEKSTPEHIAATIVHENKHHAVHNKDRWTKAFDQDYDNKDQSPEIDSPLTGKTKNRANLLDELEAYGSQNKFRLYLLQQGGLTEEQKFNLLKVMFDDQLDAKKAIQTLKKHPDSANKNEVQDWLNEVEKEWESLSTETTLLVESNLPKLAGNKEWDFKDLCYDYLIERYKEKTNDDDRKACLEKFNKYINEESDSVYLKWLTGDLTNNSKTPDIFKELIIKRFTSDEIQANLKDSIVSSISDKDPKWKMYGYKDIVQCHKLCKDSPKLQERYFEMFKKYISKENDCELLAKLSSSEEEMLPEFQELARQRLETILKSQNP